MFWGGGHRLRGGVHVARARGAVRPEHIREVVGGCPPPRGILRGELLCFDSLRPVGKTRNACRGHGSVPRWKPVPRRVSIRYRADDSNNCYAVVQYCRAANVWMMYVGRLLGGFAGVMLAVLVAFMAEGALRGEIELRHARLKLRYINTKIDSRKYFSIVL